MGTVLDFKSIHEVKVKKSGPAAIGPVDRNPLQIYCKKCSASVFRLFTHNMVTCVGCGSLMRNLSISIKETT